MRTLMILIAASIIASGTAIAQCQSGKMTSKQSGCSAATMTSKQESGCSGSKMTAKQTSCSAATMTSVAGKPNIVETAVAAGSFNTLVAAVKAAGLADVLQGDGPFTVFAPTDDAFKKIPSETIASLLEPKNKAILAGILTYHVVPGRVTADKVVGLSNATSVNGQRVDISTKDGKVFVDGAKVVTTDIACSNGIIHVIDTVIMPSSKDIVATAIDAGSFKTLVAAVKAAELVETLQGKGPFTVFAPTDEAFAKLPKDLVASLLEPKNKSKLVDILTYHVVPGRVYADQVVGLKSASSVQGSPIGIAVKDGAVMLNGNSKVVATDIETTNGVIHVIDTVILPTAGS